MSHQGIKNGVVDTGYDKIQNNDTTGRPKEGKKNFGASKQAEATFYKKSAAW